MAYQGVHRPKHDSAGVSHNAGKAHRVMEGVLACLVGFSPTRWPTLGNLRIAQTSCLRNVFAQCSGGVNLPAPLEKDAWTLVVVQLGPLLAIERKPAREGAVVLDDVRPIRALTGLVRDRLAGL